MKADYCQSFIYIDPRKIFLQICTTLSTIFYEFVMIIISTDYAFD